MGIEEIEDTLDFLEALGGGSRAECEARVRYAMSVEQGVIVELGVLRGQGLCCLACGSNFGHGVPVYGIDLFGMRASGQGPTYDDPKNERVTREFVKRFGVDHLVTVIRSDSLEACQNWTAPIGLLEIDAGHEYEQVAADAKAWLPHVMSGGLLMMHDAHNPAWPGVDRVITEQIVSGGTWEEVEFVSPFSQWFRKKA